MANVLIVAYLLIVLALIAVILLQRSEGGGLGMGTSNSNGLVSVRGTANLLTRTTAILAALFFAAAIGLTILTELDRGTSTILERAAQGGEAPATVLDALEQMQQQSGGDLPLPADATTPAPTPTEGATTTAPAASSDLPVPAEAAPAAEPAPATTETPAAPAN
jgi:preprotein translocase subunit SecG